MYYPMKKFNFFYLRTLLAALILPILSVIPLQQAHAYQIPADAANSWAGVVGGQTASKSTPSGVRVNIALTGTLIINAGGLNNTTLMAGPSTFLTPALPAATNGLWILSGGTTTTALGASCTTSNPSTLNCDPFGTLTVNFTDSAGQPIPVRNPVMHIARVAGTAGTGRFGVVHTLTSSGATLGAPSAGSGGLTVSGNVIAPALTALFDGACPVTTGGAVTAGCGSIPITGTVSTLAFNIGALRLSTATAWNVIANANDAWLITFSFDEDFGDAPATFQGATGAASTAAASHILSDLALGSAFTTNNNYPITLNGTAAGGAAFLASPVQVAAGTDNNSGTGEGAEENGLVTPLPALTTDKIGGTYTLTPALSGASRAGKVCGWIDFNRDGVFTATEGTCTAFGTGAASAALVWSVPAATTAGNAYVRIRASYDTTLSASTPNGLLNSGEVEDYNLEIKPVVKIVKVVSPTTDTGTFNLTINGTTFATAVGNGGTTGFKSVYQATTTANDVTVGTNVASAPITGVVLTETAAGTTSLANYATTSSCINAAGTAVTVGGTAVAPSITIPQSLTGASANGQAQTITCTLTNTNNKATLKVSKTAIGAGGSSFPFTIAGALTGSVTLNPNAGSTVSSTPFTNVTTGSVITITEGSPPGPTFSLAAINCTNAAGTPAGSVFTYDLVTKQATVNLVPSADVNCTFVNTRNVDIAIVKNSVGGNGTFAYTVTNTSTSAIISSPSITTTGGTGAASASISVPNSGTVSFSIAEAATAGFDLTSLSCATSVGSAGTLTTTSTNLAGGVINLTATPGTVGVCTFVNTKKPTITIRKTSVGGTGSFDFTGGTNGVVTPLTLATTTTNPQSSTAFTVASSTAPVSITETVPAGWVLQGWQCTTATGTVVASGSTPTMTIPGTVVDDGNDLVCTFTNILLPKITVNKVSIGGTGSFTFSGNNGFVSQTFPTLIDGSPSSGAQQTLAATGTSTTITESAPAAGFVLSNISCTSDKGGTTAYDITNRTATLDAAATAGGAVIACTFTNRRPVITVTKQVSPSPLVIGDAGQSYIITINVANGPTTAAMTLADTLPLGITASGALLVNGATLGSCTSLSSCIIPANSVAPITVTVPITVGNTAVVGATGGNNTATVTGGGDPLCTGTAPACSGSVVVAIAPTILAVNDPAASLIPAGTIPATGGVTTTSVTANDNTNGTPIVLGTNASMTVGTFTAPAAGSITLSPTTGLITVAAGTTPGTYTVPYTICTIPATTPTATCSTANATVVVTPVITPVTDSGTAVAGTASTPIANIRSNDSVNGVAATASNSTIALDTTSPALPTGMALNTTTGAITTTAATPPGTYTFIYKLCDLASPANCALMTDTVTVTASITATADTPPAIPATGGSTASVVANDTTNGVPVVIGTNATLTPGTIVSPPAGGSIVMNPDGTITVAAGTTPGTYTVPYTICTIPATTPTATCSTANATVVVAATILAVNDPAASLIPAGTIPATGGVTTTSVTANDNTNGTPIVLGSNASMTVGTFTAPALGSITLSPTTGLITVAPGTTPGTYTVPYTICTIPATTPTATCSTANATVVVAAVITPVTESGSAFAGNPSTPIANVAANDTVNGVQATLGSSGNATVAQVGTWPSGITLDPVTGAIKNDATVVAGVYDVVYKLCDKSIPVNCKDMTDRITVTLTPLFASNDVFSGANGTTGNPNIGNALTNDTVNGAVATVGASGNSVLTILEPATPNTAGAPVPSVDPATGIVSVPPGTPGSAYVIKYKLCEKLNPTNCKEATITVPIAAIDVVKAVGVPKQVGPKVFEVSYSIVVANVCASAPAGCAGTPTSFNVQVNDNLKPTFPTATAITVSNYVVSNGANGAICTPASVPFQGTAAANGLFSGTNDLTGGQSCVATFKVTVDFGTGDLPTISQNNLAYASAVASDTVVNPGYTYSASGTPIAPPNAVATDISTTAPATSGPPGTLPVTPLPPTTVGGDSAAGVPTGITFTVQDDGALSIKKSTVTKITTAGEVVEYSVVVSSSSSNPTKTKVTDKPPVGFEYVAGSAKVNGVASGAPISSSGELIFDVGTIPAKSSIELRYQMKLGDTVEGGEATNCVIARGVNTLTATDKESAQSCATVIVQTGLFLEKRAGVKTAELGDSVEYSLRVKSVGGTTRNVTISDNLPLGFKLIEGTVKLVRAGVITTMANPAGSPGPALTYNAGTVANKEIVEIRYRVRLGVGADLGDGINRAQAKAPFATSSLVATAKVLVTRGVFTREACVAGKVFVDCNQNGGQDKGERNGVQDKGELGIPGVRLYMEDGTNITTDENGQYSICGVRAISHVMQVDTTTMPIGSRMGITSNRNLGDGVSLLMNIKAGELYRADFIEGSCTPNILEQVNQRIKTGAVNVPVTVSPPKPVDFDSSQQGYSIPFLCTTQPDSIECRNAGSVK